jgi:hypothetical protein
VLPVEAAIWSAGQSRGALQDGESSGGGQAGQPEMPLVAIRYCQTTAYAAIRRGVMLIGVGFTWALLARI